MNRYLLPLLGFLVILAFLAVGLKLDPREVPSPLIDKASPTFEAPSLDPALNNIKRDDFLGKVWLLNVWASWCVGCLKEHPLLNELSKQQIVTMVGLNYKNERRDAQAWLKRYGNPYDHIAYDLDGEIGIDYGVYGVPETFLIDKKGIILYKSIGPIDRQKLQEIILPTIHSLQ